MNEYFVRILGILKTDCLWAVRGLWLIIAAFIFLTLLNWIGFAVWTKYDLISLVKAVRWEHVLGIVALIMLFRFRPELGRMLDRIKSVKVSKSGFEGQLDPIKLVNARQDIEIQSDGLTVQDVRELLRFVPGIDYSKIDADAGLAHTWFLRNGIRTRNRLLDLVHAETIFRFLAQLYIEVLGRSPEHPLDPVSVATWGVTLFVYGPTEDVISFVENQVRRSPEARRRQ
ncbi:hypothetical protein ACYFX5_19330 [Bremerella sp. T1]|uniref:hypothetical protein n=1 Tax=Bremerella sp. TYQ1 TaxID=3119568 RepID=UPI001CCBCAB3|nr:hypothetical protein [Bremerella volcania]UBM35199.1 hypothetical protein LA756_21280 [Bremerella volcania]